jgi:TrmH family RNA methyltransferase
VKVVRSRANPLFRTLLRLKDSPRERRRSGKTLLEGPQLVADYIEHGGPLLALAASESALDAPEVKSLLARAKDTDPVVFPPALFREASSVTTPSGLVAVVPIPQSVPASPDVACCVLLEAIQDPGNVGSILRSAAAAGVRHVLLSQGCADVWSPRVLRAAMGAHYRLAIWERAGLARYAHAFAGQVVVSDAAARRSIYDLDLTIPTAFAFGNEGAGLSAGLRNEADIVAAVPMARGVDSLNVGAAAAVFLFERARQLGARQAPQ